MQNFQDTFETLKWSFNVVFSICMTVPLKVKVTQGTVLDFDYCSCYLQTKKTAWKGGDAIFLQPVMLQSLLAQFWKVLIKIKQLERLMAVSLTPKN